MNQGHESGPHPRAPSIRFREVLRELLRLPALLLGLVPDGSLALARRLELPK
jgi:hypothetical protein